MIHDTPEERKKRYNNAARACLYTAGLGFFVYGLIPFVATDTALEVATSTGILPLILILALSALAFGLYFTHKYAQL